MYVNLEFTLGKRKFKEWFYVTGLGKQRIILGFPWLHKYNLIINWKKGEITFKPFWINWRRLREKGKRIWQEQQPKIEEVVDNEEPKNRMTLPLKENKMGVYIKLLETDVWIHKTNITMELAIEENSKKTDKTDEQLVLAEYHEYLDIFSEEKAHCFPESRPWDHKIELKEGFEPKLFENYNLTLAEQIELDKFLKENLKKGYIRPSQLPMASPFFFVSKKDGKLWPCQDYRYLNDWTVKNSYPLPLISKILDKLKGAKYFTKLDVCWGYNNIWIKKGDKWKAAFKMNKGLFEPTVMFFEMCNSLATFQAMMDDIFMTMIDNRLVSVYMDDILIFVIFADTKEELERVTKLVLEKLWEHDLFLKAKKCEFCQKRIEYLGMIIEEGKISMDAVKLGGIRDWPVPTTLKQTRSFLGFGNFYPKLIFHYSELAWPLNNLTEKDKKFEWTTECQRAFDTMKKRFTEEPVLLMPDQSKPFQIESDTSKVATGTVLPQLDSNGDWHPIPFLSKTFSETERKYEIYDQELLGIIWALKEWRHYIQGSGHTMIVYSDHKSLTYFRTAQKLNDQQARWSLYLSGFDLKLIHLPGTKMVQFDALSRRPDYGTDKQMEENNKVVLPDNLFINLLDTELQEQILNGKELDLDVKNAIETLMEEGPTSLKNDLQDWKIEEIDGQKTIFFKGKNYIPKDLELRWDIVKMYNDHKMAGHPGELETYNGIRQNY
jgi:RNase H-like domain found in reverse transcriptase/Reverse transcriptase (RNA-dependent DNA polymerase)